MPEGHTIHRTARDHHRSFAGQKLRVSSPQGRFDDGSRQLTGRRLESVNAYGKHLFYQWEGELLLHVHLGLYGKFRQHEVPLPEPQGQVRLRVIGTEAGFDLNGPNSCKLISREQADAVTDRLGPDPLRRDADPEAAWQRIRSSQSALGALLLDQSVIAGIGNVYRADLLHILRIHPERTGDSLKRAEFDRLWTTIKDLMKIGVRYNRIITTDPQVIGTTLGRMQNDERLLVYKREFCRRCEGPIESWKLAARTIFACPRCQPKR